MSASAPLVFSGITPEQYNRLTAKAHAAGIELAGSSGTAEKFGVEVAWDYAPETGQLTLQCLRTPFFISTGEVHAKLQSLVQETLAEA